MMSFIGCIGNLMKGSGLGELLGTKCGLAGMLNDKSWPRGMRAFRMAFSVVMSDYLGGDDSHTFDQLTVHISRRHRRRTVQFVPLLQAW